MNEHFPPLNSTSSGSERELDLGSFPVVSQPAKSSWLNIINKRDAQPPVAADEALSAQGKSRRNFIKAGAGAAVVACVSPPLINHFVAQNYDEALLKRDPDTNMLALMHRRCSASAKEATIEDVSKGDVITGAGELTLAPRETKPELLVISPELFCDPKRDRNAPAGANHASIAGNPSNIFIPYHLFAKAGSFDIRIKTNREGKERLCIEIVGMPTVQSVPILKAVSEGTGELVHDSTTAVKDGLGRVWSAVQDGWDSLTGESGNHMAETVAQQQQSAAEYAVSKPHHIAQNIFSIDLDYEKGHVPNFYFFNGKTLSNPTYCIPGDMVEQRIPPEPKTDAEIEKNPNGRCFELMPGAHQVCNFTGADDDGCTMRYSTAERFFDKQLARRVTEATLLANSAPTQGGLPAVLGYLGNKALGDDKLNGYEMGAMNLAARSEQAVQKELAANQWFGSTRMAFERLDMGTPDIRATPQAITRG